VLGAPRIPGPRRPGGTPGHRPPPDATAVPRPRAAPEPYTAHTVHPAHSAYGTPPADHTAEADMSHTPFPPTADSADDGPGSGGGAGLTHTILKSLLGAWALAACSTEETAAVERHLSDCAICAEEARRLRGAVELLHTERDLDLPASLRFRVLENCLVRRPPRIPVPDWAAPYDAETARLDALLRDIGERDWNAPVPLRWFDGRHPVEQTTTVSRVIGHLMSVDGLVSGALGLDDPVGREAPRPPTERTEKFWRAESRPTGRATYPAWRGQSHVLLRTVSFAGPGAADMSVSYGDFSLPLRDAMIDRAFECWIHADDIALAVAYPYRPPRGPHLNRMIDLAARLLPAALAGRRRAGLAGPVKHLVAAGSPGRSVHLEVEGAGGGDWYIALDSPAALGSPDHTVAQVVLEAVEFCKLVAGHVSPEEAAAGQDGDREAIRDVLFAAASLSRM
ncbi:maleylpyruvate isomerase N-terminal domain-containing protein, partial [Streptomyces sp. NPDC058953]